MAPPDKDLEWSYEGVEGMYRWLEPGVALRHRRSRRGRTRAAASPLRAIAAAKTLHREMHRVIGKVTDDVERFQFNTAIAAMMELTNAAYDYRNAVAAGSRDIALQKEVAERLTLLLAPFTPYMAEELWREVLAAPGSVHAAEWPAFDASAAAADEVELAVQVNGKVRGKIVVDASAAEDDVVELR